VTEYEVVFIIKATETDEAIDALVEQLEEVAKQRGAEIIDIDRWGRRKLAYDIGKQREGYYVLFLLRAETTAIAELERRMKMNDAVIRFLTVRTDLERRRETRRTLIRARRKGVPPESLAPPRRSGFHRDEMEEPQEEAAGHRGERRPRSEEPVRADAGGDEGANEVGAADGQKEE